MIQSNNYSTEKQFSYVLFKSVKKKYNKKLFSTNSCLVLGLDFDWEIVILTI